MSGVAAAGTAAVVVGLAAATAVEAPKSDHNKNHDACIATTSEDPTTSTKRRRRSRSSTNHKKKQKRRRTTTTGAAAVASATSTFLSTISGGTSSSYADLMVPWPAAKDRPKVLVRALLERLEASGCTVVALSHTVYGAPPPLPSSDPRRHHGTNDDNDDNAFPDDVTTLFRGKGTLRVVRRLHAVVESLSDVGLYTTRPSTVASSSMMVTTTQHHDGWQKWYDVVSMAPRTEAAFRACCASATAAAIITLDYSSSSNNGGGGSIHHRLPYRIRSDDVKAAVQRGASFEILYAPAILNSGPIRRSFVQTLRAVHDAGKAWKPCILLSSGCRHKYHHANGASGVGEAFHSDVGTLALRPPGDLINLLECVCHLSKASAVAALSAASARTTLLAAAPQLRTATKVPVVVASLSVYDSGEAIEKSGDDGAPTTTTTETPTTFESVQRPAAVPDFAPLSSVPRTTTTTTSHDDGYIAL